MPKHHKRNHKTINFNVSFEKMLEKLKYLVRCHSIFILQFFVFSLVETYSDLFLWILLFSAYTDFENKCNINIFFLYFYIIDNDFNAANPFSNSVQNTIQNFSFLISSIVLQKTLPLIICESGHHILVIAEPSTKKVQTVSFLIPILFDKM